MAIILDADVIIRGERRTFDLRELMTRHAAEPFEIAAITVAELWHGVERATAAHRANRERYLGAVLGTVSIIPYTQATAFEHARIWAVLEGSGKMIGYYDLIVAATALERGSVVMTFNKRHFAHVPALKVVEPV